MQGDVEKAALVFAEDRDPWDQQPWESTEQHSRFAYFLAIGRHRKYRMVAEKFQLSLPTVRELAWRYKWTDRAASWDRDRERDFTSKIADARLRCLHEDLEIIGNLLDVAMTQLQAKAPEDMSTSELIKLLGLCLEARATRLGYAQPAGAQVLVSQQNTSLSSIPVVGAGEDRDAQFAELVAEYQRRQGGDALAVGAG